MIMAVATMPEPSAIQKANAGWDNLRPAGTPGGVTPWQPGQSGNPKGRPKAGAVIAEWYDQLAGCEREELEKIRDNPRTPVAKRAAAIEWLNASSEDRTAAGMPINGVSTDRISDRTSGRPQSNANINHTGTIGHVHLDAAAIARLPPAKLAALAAILGDMGIGTDGTTEGETVQCLMDGTQTELIITQDVQIVNEGEKTGEMEKGQTADQPISHDSHVLDQPSQEPRETGIQ